MSYVLIDGKRHHKNDQTGEVSIDNVSQETADRRSLQRSTPPHPSQPPPTHPAAARTKRSRRSGPVSRFVGLLHRILRTTTVLVLVGSILLTGMYCLKEPVQFHADFRCELRDMENTFERAAQVYERLTLLLEAERGNRND